MAGALNPLWAAIVRSIAGSAPPWRVGRRLWALAIGSYLVAAGGLALAAMAWMDARAEAERLRLEVEHSRAAAVAARDALGAADAQPDDFVQRLPQGLQAEAVVRKLQRSSQLAKVKLQSVSSSYRAPSADVLARLEISASLRGDYPSIKQVVGDMLAAHPYASLRRLALRRGPSAEDTVSTVEAEVVLSFWGQPESSSALPPPAVGAR